METERRAQSRRQAEHSLQKPALTVMNSPPPHRGGAATVETVPTGREIGQVWCLLSGRAKSGARTRALSPVR